MNDQHDQCQQHDQSPNQDSRRLGFMLGAGVSIFMSVAALSAGMDMLHYGYARSIAQASQMILWWAAFVIPAGLVAGAIALGITKLSRGLLPASLIVAGLLGVTLQFATALLFEDRNLLVSVPVPWIIAYGVYRCLTRSGVGAAWLLRGFAIVAVTAIWVPFAIAAGVQVQRLSALIVWGGGLLAVPVVGQWIVVKRPKIFLTIAVLLLGFVQWQGQSMIAWQRNEIEAPGSVANHRGSTTPQRPNVVLIVLDTTRADRLGCYGNGANITPNIDALAAQGVCYKNAIASSSWTVPTHASLFTGYYLKTHGCGTDPHRWLDDGFVTLAEILGEAGYQTLSLSSNYLVEATNLLQGFNTKLRIDVHRFYSRFMTWIRRMGLPAAWADQGASACVQGLREWFDTDYKADAPFFLFVNLLEAHTPDLPPAKWRADQLAEDVGYWEAEHVGRSFFGVNWYAGEQHSKRSEKIIRSLYDGSVAYEDFQVGQLIKLLDQHVDMDNTIVVITADHGENLGEGGRWGHAFALNDTLVRVPLIVRYPPAFPAGTRLSGQVETVDVPATLLDLVGLPRSSDDWPGHVITPGKYEPRQYTFAELFPRYESFERMVAIRGFQKDVASFSASKRMIRTNQYKYVWSSRGNHALYDVAKDPAESRNLITAYPEIAASLRKELDRWYAATPSYVPRTQKLVPVDKDVLDNLRSLGYVGD